MGETTKKSRSGYCNKNKNNEFSIKNMNFRAFFINKKSV